MVDVAGVGGVVDVDADGADGAIDGIAATPPLTLLFNFSHNIDLACAALPGGDAATLTVNDALGTARGAVDTDTGSGVLLGPKRWPN